MNTRRRTLAALCALSTLGTTGCLDFNRPPAALRAAQASGGPKIVFDLEERPFPEIPFPSDIATRPDPDSPTGIRVNISARGGTLAEEKVRRYVNQQVGFATFASLAVKFDAPLDLESIALRHQEPVPDFADDVVYLVNVDEDSEGFGELVMLDMGRGNYPLLIKSPDRYFDNDPKQTGVSLVVETLGEVDVDGDGLPDEDLDDDGVYDRPNTFDPNGDPLAVGQLLDFYERETNTLIMRPVVPLREGTTYAVVLTDELKGEDGVTIDSPFEGINHTRQTVALGPLEEILPEKLPERFDEDLSAVRFAWTFTTDIPTRELDMIRAGLYGHGELSWMKDTYPPEIHLLHTAKQAGSEEPITFNLAGLLELATPLIAQALGAEGGGEEVAASFDSVDYVVSGSFLSPYLLKDTDGVAQPIPEDIELDDQQAVDRLNTGDDDESFPADIPNLTPEQVGLDEVPFLCVVPKPTPTQQAPFPTILYSHAITSTRFEGLAFAGVMAKFGMATCVIEAVGHGIQLPGDIGDLLRRVAGSQGIPNLSAIIQHSRGRDLTNDSLIDIGGKFFTADLLHSRDSLRQTAVDQFQFVRILRSFDGTNRFPDTVDEASPYVRARRSAIAGFDQDGDGKGELAGDFNGDGVIDLGGEQTLVAWGTSLGGIQTGLIAGAEPLIKVMASNAGGAGLGDIAARSDIVQVRVGAMLRLFGQLLLGSPSADGSRTELYFQLPSAADDVRVPFASVPALEDGDRVVFRNITREANPFGPDDTRVKEAEVRDGRFRVGIACDGDESTHRHAVMGFDRTQAFDELIGCDEAEEADKASCRETVTSMSLTAQVASHILGDTLQFGDELKIEIYDGQGNLKHEIDTFEDGALYDNIYYPPGAPLAALIEGWGLERQTPTMRKFLTIGQMLLEPADPAVWGQRYMLRPHTWEYETEKFRFSPTNGFIVGTLGDQTVPINTSITMARAAGFLDYMTLDERYDATANQFLVKNHVYEGLAKLNRFEDKPGMLFDPDDLDDGAWRASGDMRSSPEAERPLRAQLDSPHYEGINALRLPYLREGGDHTFNVPQPGMAFDIHTYMLNATGWYLATGSRELRDDPCFEADLQMSTCDFYDPQTFKPTFPE